jgi:hypothetical protein
MSGAAAEGYSNVEGVRELMVRCRGELELYGSDAVSWRDATLVRGCARHVRMHHRQGGLQESQNCEPVEDSNSRLVKTCLGYFGGVWEA